MIDELIKANCIKIGNFKLKNGEVSKYYYDMKNLISHPKLLKKVGDTIYNMLDDFDIICGIPYGALPIATYISIQYNKPMIYIRDKVKNYGTEKLIEGEYKKEDRCVIIDDVITTGNSLEAEILKLQKEVTIVDIAVVFNRQQNPFCSMKFKAMLCKNDVTRYMLQHIKDVKKSSLIFSADISDMYMILTMLDKIGKYIVGCKIHYDIIRDWDESFSSKITQLSIKHNFLIIEDRKFNDISYIVSKQYERFRNWVDMVTVHSLVTPDVIKKLSGALIVANMSNNTYDFTPESKDLAEECYNNVVGFITQKRIDLEGMVNMTPGIRTERGREDDQRYRNVGDVNTDFIIVGRALYLGDLAGIEDRVKRILSLS